MSSSRDLQLPEEREDEIVQQPVTRGGLLSPLVAEIVKRPVSRFRAQCQPVLDRR